MRTKCKFEQNIHVKFTEFTCLECFLINTLSILNLDCVRDFASKYIICSNTYVYNTLKCRNSCWMKLPSCEIKSRQLHTKRKSPILSAYIL